MLINFLKWAMFILQKDDHSSKHIIYKFTIQYSHSDYNSKSIVLLLTHDKSLTHKGKLSLQADS